MYIFNKTFLSVWVLKFKGLKQLTKQGLNQQIKTTWTHSQNYFKLLFFNYKTQSELVLFI